MSKFPIVGLAAVFFVLFGCQEQESDTRLIKVAVEQDKHTGEIDRISNRVEGFEKRLVEIQQLLAKIVPPTGAPEPAETAETEASGPKEVEFKDIPEYEQIALQISDIQQRLNLVRDGIANVQQDTASEQEMARRQDPAEAWRTMNNPQELSDRLNALAQNFAQKIEDPTRRQQFEVDVEQVKRGLFDKPTTQQLYQQVVSDLTERLNNEENERAQQFIERQIAELQAASAEELQGRLERYQRFNSFRQLRELQSKYDIPREVYRDAGLPSIGRERGGPGRGGRGGAGPGGQ